MSNKLNDSCTPTNAVQNLAKDYGTSNARLRSGVERQVEQLGPSGSLHEQFAQEYLSKVGRQTAAPQTFNVRQLLAQPQSSKWADDFVKTQRAGPADQWAADFRQRQAFNMKQLGQDLPNQWADEFRAHMARNNMIMPAQHEKWSEEFDQWSKNNTAGNAEQAWMQAQTGSSTADDWANEFANFEESHKVPLIDQSTLDAEFDKIFHAGMDEWSGVEDLTDEMPFEYQFSENNPHAGQAAADLMEQGESQIRAGNTQEAILIYEAQVKQNPQDSKAWCQLGLCHAENEHDIAAMSAFRHALQLDSKYRDALLGYSVSLANENYTNEALTQLEKWLNSYLNLDVVETEQKSRIGFYGAFIDPQRFQKIENRFLEAARAQTNADPELQNALGVLYNLNGTFDRAVDSIKTAIARNPDDPRLWNRLGATLANSDRTAEAIEAYRHALQLFPAYVRARYNLGISCMHLNCHREAVDHFLSALRLQKAPEHSPIWSTLRSALIRLESTNPRVMEALNRHDVDSVQHALANPV